MIRLDSRRPSVSIGSLGVTTAPTVAELYTVLGQPSRVVAAGGAAPAGHRNNQIHVYDPLGLRLNEHHHTFRVQELALSFDCEEPLFPFTPRSPFAGELWIDEEKLPLPGPVGLLVERCPIPLEQGLGGAWSWRRNDFYVGAASRGPRLRSGRRSKQRLVVEVSLCWPHDPWAAPPPAGETR